ncbi:MAG: hypothetical protein ABIL27_06670 [candidate division WOR-3 bacterium]
MIFIVFQIAESDYGYIFDVDDKRVFVFKPYYSRKNFISTDTSLPFTSELINGFRNRLKDLKPHAILVYPKTEFKIDGVKYSADIVEGIPEGIHTVEILGYVKAKINFKDYDVFVFITKVPREYKEKSIKEDTREKPIEKGEEGQLQQRQSVGLYRSSEIEFYVSEGAGAVCGAAGGCAGCILGAFISGNTGLPFIPYLFGALGFYFGYTACKGYVKRSCFGY